MRRMRTMSRPLLLAIVAGIVVLAAGLLPALADEGPDASPNIEIDPAPDQLQKPDDKSADRSSDHVGSEGEESRFTSLTGTLERCGMEYCIGATEADFGPQWYLSGSEASRDYDDNGMVESLADEIAGLVGNTVTLTVDYGRMGDADVFALDGAPYRDEIGPPPWAGGPLRGRGGDDGTDDGGRREPPPWVPGPAPWEDEDDEREDRPHAGSSESESGRPPGVGHDDGNGGTGSKLPAGARGVGGPPDHAGPTDHAGPPQSGAGPPAGRGP